MWIDVSSNVVGLTICFTEALTISSVENVLKSTLEICEATGLEMFQAVDILGELESAQGSGGFFYSEYTFLWLFRGLGVFAAETIARCWAVGCWKEAPRCLGLFGAGKKIFNNGSGPACALVGAYSAAAAPLRPRYYAGECVGLARVQLACLRRKLARTRATPPDVRHTRHSHIGNTITTITTTTIIAISNTLLQPANYSHVNTETGTPWQTPRPRSSGSTRTMMPATPPKSPSRTLQR